MKNITVSIDDEVYRRARIKAAERGTSVSALVRCHLEALAAEEAESERLKRQEHVLRAMIRDFSAADRLPRDAVHAREDDGVS